MVATSAYSTFCAVFRSSGHAGIEGVNEVASRLCVLVVGWLALSQGAGLLGIVVVYAVVDVLSLGALGLAFDRLTRTARNPIDHDRLRVSAGEIARRRRHRDHSLLPRRHAAVALIKGPRVVGQYAARVPVLRRPADPRDRGRSAQHPAHERARRPSAGTSPLAPGPSFPAVHRAARDHGPIVGAEPLLSVVFGAKYDGAATTLRILACRTFLTTIVMVVLPPLALRSGRAAGRALVLARDERRAQSRVHPTLRCRRHSDGDRLVRARPGRLPL